MYKLRFINDMLHGVRIVILEEVYCTDMVTRVAQNNCGPTDGFKPTILEALLQYCFSAATGATWCVGLGGSILSLHGV